MKYFVSGLIGLQAKRLAFSPAQAEPTLSGGSIQYEIRSFDYNTMKEWYKDLGNINEYLKYKLEW
jgi:hypothetical protein